MANTFLTPDVIVPTALAALHESLGVAKLVYTDPSKTFTGQKVGDTVNVRRPVVLEAKDFNRATGIEVQNATESSIPVKLDKIADVSLRIPTEQLKLDISDFDAQVVSPAMMALAQKIDRAVLSLRADVTQEAGIGTVVDPADPAYDPSLLWNKPEVLIEAGRFLDANKLPETERYAVIGTSAKAKWLNTELLKSAEKSGSTEALRRGSLGRDLFGFETFMTQNIEAPKAVGSQVAGDPTTEVGVAFHPTAFCLVAAPLDIDPGMTGAVETFNGVSVRVAYQYDINTKETIISFDTLYGIKTLDASRAVLLKGADKA